jgi:hypothetical protein
MKEKSLSIPNSRLIKLVTHTTKKLADEIIVLLFVEQIIIDLNTILLSFLEINIFLQIIEVL